MPTASDAIHLCFGDPEIHLRELEAMSKRQRKLGWWTTDRTTRKNDQALFYLTAPSSAIVARGRFAEDAWLNTDKSSGWHDHYVAKLRNVELLNDEVPLSVLRKHLSKKWPYINFPRRSARVPDEVAPDLLALIESNLKVLPYADVGAIEGTLVETTRLMKSRSNRLRGEALRAAAGICEVCGTNFSELLEGKGVRVLQVHHRKQLSERDMPSLTRLKDLSVLCANCHMLLHSKCPPLNVARLRKMLHQK